MRLAAREAAAGTLRHCPFPMGALKSWRVGANRGGSMPLIPGAERITWDYAGMELSSLASWIVLATLIGFVSRAIVKGPRPLGLWGDMVIALVGAYLVGAGMRALDFDLSQSILAASPALGSRWAVLIDVGLTALVGALLIRLVLRVAAGRQ